MGVTTAKEGQGETRWNQRRLLVVAIMLSLVGWWWGLSTGSLIGVVFALLLITAGVAALYVGNRRARTELEEIRAELEEMRGEAKEAKTKLKVTEDELKTAKTDLEDTRTNLQRTRAKLGEMLIYIDELRRRIVGPSEIIEQLEAELEEMKAELKETNAELGNTKKKLDSKTAALNETQKRLEDCLGGDEPPPGTGLVIENVGGDNGEEVLVKLTNDGTEPIALGGCSMVDGDGRRFRGFSDGFELDANDSETFMIEKGFGIESTEPVTLYRDDDPIGRIRWEPSV